MLEWLWLDGGVMPMYHLMGARSVHYQPMVDAVGGVGLGFKGPFYHDLRGSLLKNAIHDIRCYLSGIKANWGAYGFQSWAMGRQIKDNKQS